MMYAVHNDVARCLYRVPNERRIGPSSIPVRKKRMIEPTSATTTGKRFNLNAANKTCHGHIDIVV